MQVIGHKGTKDAGRLEYSNDAPMKEMIDKIYGIVLDNCQLKVRR